MVGRATPGWGAALGLLALLALPPVASAENPIPPGNSAVDQYTESYPSASGDMTTRGGEHTPVQVLGQRKARRLQARGPAGEATAALTVATAPAPIGTGSAPGAAGAATEERAGGVSGPGATGGAKSAPAFASDTTGLGEVLAETTGLSGDGPGALLPLAIVLIAAWALAYLWRRRHPTA